MIMIQRTSAALSIALVAWALGGCGGGSDDVALGGTVSGLPTGSTVMLANNGANILSVNGSGEFAFPGGVVEGGGYDVTVQSQPAGATCAVADGVGSAATLGEDVTDVQVDCTAGTTVGGTVAGLAAGTGVTLSDGNTTLPVTASGVFAFTDVYADGASYAVSVATQPAGQVCSVVNGSGAIDATGDAVSNVAVTCATAAMVGGTLSGLAAGSTVSLGDGQSVMAVTANGAFAFGDTFAPGAAYAVTVAGQPGGQVCAVTNGAGAIDGNGDPVTNVAIACATDGTVGGSVSGLAAGNAVTISDGINAVPVSANGSFAFADVFGAGAAYAVTVTAQPGTQTCTVTGGAGTIDAGDDPVTAIAVVCQ